MIKVEIASLCPECSQEFTRFDYLVSPGILALELCPECVDKHTDENGNWIVEITKRHEDVQDHGA